MIDSDKIFGTFDIYCDFCDECGNYDTGGDFTEFITEAKSDGWISKKDRDVWIHYCPVCAQAT